MSKALDYFLSETEMATAIEHPDKGIDLIYELTPEEWEQLLAVWESKSVEWREAMAYFGGLVDLEEGMPLLRKALYDADVNVHIEAALSIADALLDGDEFPFSDEDKKRLLELAKSQVGKDFEELQELAALLK